MLQNNILTDHFFLTGCTSIQQYFSTPSALDPRGQGAEQIANLWWIMFGLGTLIYAGVMAYLVVAIRRSVRRSEAGTTEDGRRTILLLGILFPTIVILFLFALTLGSMSALSQGSEEDQAGEIVIEVTGHQWWWEVHYPNQQFFTANEIHIPVGQPVQVKLLSDDVIHSFWVPQLTGKLDLNPGGVNTLWLTADEPGEYWGLCAEFCGVQHAKMLFLIVAEPSEQFEAWIAQQSQPAAIPEDALAREGMEVFLASTCINCHQIEGTHATGRLGPDLTHLASRRILGAQTIPNNRGNLSGWIADPQSLKPGNLMPPSVLSGAELQALLTFLETLK